MLQCGVGVAPVVQWQHHNSLYTQRYMGRPELADNWDQYNEADLTKLVDNFYIVNLQVHSS